MADKIQLQEPGKNEKRVSEAALKKIINSQSFYTKQLTSTGKDFFYFRQYGDFIQGQILGKRSNVQINRSASYQIRVEQMQQDGQLSEFTEDNHIEEFFGNKQLQRVIDRNELIGSIVKIVYIGRQKTVFSHSAKVYDVFKLTGISNVREIRQDGSKRKYKKRARTGPKYGAARVRAAEGRTK